MPKKALTSKKLLIALLLIIIGKTQLIAENLIESGRWIYFADNVMGGISVGSSEYVIVASGKAIRLYGEVSTKNNGGFIQVRMPYSIDQLEKYKGKTKDEIKQMKRRDSIVDTNKSDQVKSLINLGLTKKEIKELKYEDDRVNKIIELTNK